MQHNSVDLGWDEGHAFLINTSGTLHRPHHALSTFSLEFYPHEESYVFTIHSTNITAVPTRCPGAILIFHRLCREGLTPHPSPRGWHFSTDLTVGGEEPGRFLGRAPASAEVTGVREPHLLRGQQGGSHYALFTWLYLPPRLVFLLHLRHFFSVSFTRFPIFSSGMSVCLKAPTCTHSPGDLSQPQGLKHLTCLLHSAIWRTADI